MSVANLRTWKCDYKTCDEQRLEREHGSNTAGWFKVEALLGSCEDVFHFCSWDCIKLWFKDIPSLKKGTRGCKINGFTIRGM